MTKQLRAYLRLLAGLIMISCLGQLAFPARVAAASAWGNAPGWQREIGFWNIAIDAGCAFVVWRGVPAFTRPMSAMLVLLSAMLGGNHLAAALAAGTQPSAIHWNGFIENALAVVAGALALAFTRGDARSGRIDR